MLNLAHLHESIAAAVPDRECIVTPSRRFTWSEVTRRTRRLANFLRERGYGCHRERDALENWESGQDPIALYLYNGNEYLEGMLGAYKARCAPFNVNYRYVEKELLYLLEDAGARAIVYAAEFAPRLAAIRDRLPALELLLQVADGSGHALLPGALDYEQALASASEAAPPDDLRPDDLYVLYTGGTTGMPKGVLWRQEDIALAALLSARSPRTAEEISEAARQRRPLVALPTPPFMHGAAHWLAFSMWHVGGTLVIQSDVHRLDPDDIWSTVEREGVQHLLIVGDAFARPLLDQLEVKSYDLSSLRRLGSGGAILSPELKGEFIRRIPQLQILDALGSSESGSQALHTTKAGSEARTGEFEMGEDTFVLADDLRAPLAPGADEDGWLARRGHVPLGYLGDPEKTARTFPVIDGVRYSVPGDRARLASDGRLLLLGRDSVTINSGGEKIFAEEVELALKTHASVYDVVVVGTPSERWGQQVTAVVKLRDDAPRDEDALRDAARAHITAYKLPKAFVFVDEIVRAPSGKADYRWAKATALEALGR